ncbi:hypothetical protein GQ607_009891 [Colletotrichum asianum]|uniref:Uncharacterized protein n=1 Tax=Colletotrichum asianum TaxID=702518 RepID=A0A8H3WAN1_9PEZI|nr:hypothetical protein GQ607_009891 [Colletotrichum asianum]
MRNRAASRRRGFNEVSSYSRTLAIELTMQCSRFSRSRLTVAGCCRRGENARSWARSGGCSESRGTRVRAFQSLPQYRIVKESARNSGVEHRLTKILQYR